MIIVDSNGNTIELPNGNGKSIVENWLDYARESKNEIEQIMLGTSTALFTQKHNGTFYIEFLVKEPTAVEFGDYAINLTTCTTSELMERLKDYNDEIRENGTIEFIEKHELDFV